MVAPYEQLQCLGQSELAHCERAVLHGRAYAFFWNVSGHGVVVPHERRCLWVLRANPVEPLYERVLCLMNLLVEQLHELLHVSSRLHCEGRHYDGRGADVAASVLQLAQSVHVPSVCRAASHCREVGARVVDVESLVSAPVHVGVVGVQTLRRRAHRELLEVVVGCSWLVVHAFHVLEYSAWEYRRVVVEADALERAEQQGARHEAALLQRASAVVD